MGAIKGFFRWWFGYPREVVYVSPEPVEGELPSVIAPFEKPVPGCIAFEGLKIKRSAISLELNSDIVTAIQETAESSGVGIADLTEVLFEHLLYSQASGDLQKQVLSNVVLKREVKQ